MNRIRLISLIVLICVLLTGCSSKSGGGKASGTSENLQSQLAESTTASVPKTQTHFYDGHIFSDNVVWVQRDSTHWECIDDKGNTLFSLGADSVPVTDFTDGAALIKTTNSKNEEDEKIVDKSGVVVFPKDDGYKYQFIVSYGNYNFVKRHINTFEKTEDQTGIVDNTGKWVLEPTPDLTDVGDLTQPEPGIICVNYHGNNYYDAYSNGFFKSSIDSHYLEYLRQTIGYHYQEDLVPLYNENGQLSEGGIQYYISHYSDLADIGFHNTGTGFYDRNYNLVIDLSSYKNVQVIGGFSGGYCSVIMDNPQGNPFCTVIDKKGNRMFEPIPQQIGKVSCGCILVQSTNGNPGYYIDVNGKTIIPNITNGSDFSEDGLAKIGVSNSGTNGIYYIDTDGNIAF